MFVHYFTFVPFPLGMVEHRLDDLRDYTVGQIFRKGIVLDFVGIVLLVFVVTRIWELLRLI